MRPGTIPARVRDWVERAPDRRILTFRDLEAGRDHVSTYAELWARAGEFGAALVDLEPEARVLIVLPLGTELFAAHLGALRSSAIPIVHSHPSPKMDAATYLRNLSHVFTLLSPEAVVTTRAFLPALGQSGRAAARIVLAEAVRGEDPRLDRRNPARSDSTAVIQHSSGSTGLQKGVALHHDMVLGQCAAYAKAIQADADSDTICSWLPLYHDMGLFTTWLLPVLHGIPVAALDPFSWVRQPSSLLRLITDVRGTLCWQPNFAYNLLATRVGTDDLAGLDLRTMRGFTNCSEPVRAASHRAFLDRFGPVGVSEAALWVCYAMAENSFAVTAAGRTTVPVTVERCSARALSASRVEAPAGDDDAAAEVVSVGAPIEGCETKLVNERREKLADGQIGEIAVRSPFLLRGYYRDAAVTAEAIDAEGWYYTGDLGFQNGGQLYVTGRKKDLLIVGGRNFYPQDIEAIADVCPHAIPGRSVAIGVADEATGTERIVVLVETHASELSALAELSAAVRGRVLEELDCPLSEVHAVPHMWLHKTSSGKIARLPNLERYRAQLAAPAADSRADAASASEVVGWALLVALAVYVSVALQPSLSWGVYAGF